MRQSTTFRRGRPVAWLFLAVVVTSCSGSSPTPVSTTTSSLLPECAWGKDAVSAPHRAIAVTRNDAVYELIDTSSGRVLGTCPTSGPDGVASYVAAYQAPTFQGRTAVDETFNALWFGGFRPGGASGTVVVTSSGTVDLASGQRVTLSAAGLRPTEVARDEIVMVRDGAGTSSTPPSQPGDWCTVPLSGQGACVAIDGAVGPGTPVVARNGAVAWLPTELTPTDIPVTPDHSGNPVSTLYVRAGSGLVTATAYVNGGTPGSFDDTLVNVDGRGFLVTPSDDVVANLAHTGRLTWYTVDDAGGLTPHEAETSFGDLAVLLDRDPANLLITDTAVADDGRSMLLTVNRDLHPVLVSVPEQGQPQIGLDVSESSSSSRPGQSYLGVNERLLTPADLPAR